MNYKYSKKQAEMADSKANADAAYKMASEDPTRAMKGPSDRDVITCAINTILPNMAISVPSPLFCLRGCTTPSRMPNWKR